MSKMTEPPNKLLKTHGRKMEPNEYMKTRELAPLAIFEAGILAQLSIAPGKYREAPKPHGPR